MVASNSEMTLTSSGSATAHLKRELESFHIFAMTGVARMTSNGSVSHIWLVYNLFKLLTLIFVQEALYKHFWKVTDTDTDIIIAHNCSKTASLMLVAKENAFASNRCQATVKVEWLLC